MRGFTEVFLLELRLRRAVFPAALIAGLMPIPMAVLMRNVAVIPEALNMGAYAFSLIGGELLALYLGATVLCQDLSEGRAGFYLSRPVSSLALWAGKVLGAWIAVLGAVVVCFLPATLAGGGLTDFQAKPNPFFVYDMGPETLSALWFPLLVAAAFLLLIAFAHAISVMARSRSTWLILDAVMLVLLPTLAWWAIRRVLSAGFVYCFIVEVVVLGSVLLVALLAAGAVQTVVGRADLKRGHKALSLTLWATLGITVLGLDAYALWATRISPSDLARVESVYAAPTGPWMLVYGPLDHRGGNAWAGVFVNADTGASRALAMARWGGETRFSPDGRLALSFGYHSPADRSPMELMACDLTAAKPEARSTGIALSGYDTALAFSPDSTRVAVQTGSDLTVYELPSWKLVAAQKVATPAESWKSLRMYFLDRDTLRLALTSHTRQENSRVKRSDLQLFEFDVRNRKLTATGTIPSVGPWTMRVNAAGDRLLVAQDETGSEASLLLCDARTGVVLKPLPIGSSKQMARFLSDGRFVVMRRAAGPGPREEAPRQATLYSAEGEELKTFDVGACRYFVWGLQPAPGKVLMNVAHRVNGAFSQEAFLLDVDSGKVQKLEGLRPASMFSWWYGSPREADAPGSPGSHLFLDDQGRVVRYDFESGAKTVVKGI